MKYVIALAVLSMALVGCGPVNHADEPWQGAKPGDNCMEKYQYSVNQNRCKLLTQEG